MTDFITLMFLFDMYICVYRQFKCFVHGKSFWFLCCIMSCHVDMEWNGMEWNEWNHHEIGGTVMSCDVM